MQTQQFDLPLNVRPSGDGPLTVLLDDFEATEIRERNPAGDPLWFQNNGSFGGQGFEETTTEEAHSGNRSLKITVESLQLNLSFLTYNGLGVSNMHAYVQPTSAWRTDTFNRLRFWIKLPSGVIAAPPGRQNANMGTYLRESGAFSDVGNNQEQGGGHWYHWLNLKYTGEWEQVIMDTHPSHERGASGNAEQADQEYVTGEPGVWNYFDALTRFYFQMRDDSFNNYPGEFYFDGFELYDDPNLENIDQVYTLHGVHVPSSNTTVVGWSRNKNENNVIHEVRYAFNDIYTTGWNAATPAPRGMITPPNSGGYNTMDYETDQIDVIGRSNVFIAIKPQNSSLFRQITIPTMK